MPIEKKPSVPTAAERRESNEIAAIEDAAREGHVVELVESPALNKLLLRNARKTPKAIEAITGIPADEVGERLVSLLDAPTIQDDLMEEKLILAEIGLLLDDIRARMNRETLDDEAYASLARVNLAASKTMLEQLDKRRKNLDGKLALITQAQAQLIGEAIKLAMDRAVFEIEKKYPSVDPEEIRIEFDAAFPLAIETLEKQTNGG